jgi:hypothetical protein
MSHWSTESHEEPPVGRTEANTGAGGDHLVAGTEEEYTTVDGLDTSDWTLIEALMVGMSHERAGALIGRSSKFVQRRLKTQAFAEALEERRRERLRDLSARRESIVERALDVLGDLLHAESEPVQLGAVRTALNEDRAHRRDHLADRVDELDETLSRLLRTKTQQGRRK